MKRVSSKQAAVDRRTHDCDDLNSRVLRPCHTGHGHYGHGGVFTTAPGQRGRSAVSRIVVIETEKRIYSLDDRWMMFLEPFYNDIHTHLERSASSK